MKRLALRRPDVCVVCSAELPTGTVAWWDAGSRSVHCVNCAESTSGDLGDLPAPDADAADDADPPEELLRGGAGRSLEREYERRRAARERRARERHPRIGGLLLALNGEPQHQAAFRSGAVGEHAVAESLERRTADGEAIILHNRRMPGNGGDIDHIAIAPTGVFVIDTKNVGGKVEIRRPWFGQPKLLIKGSDRTRYIDGLDRQVQAVRDALVRTGLENVPIQGVLCFTRADLPLLGTFEMRGHLLLYRKALAKRLNAPGPLTREAIASLAQELSHALKPA